MSPDVTLLMLNAGRRIELLRAFRRAFEALSLSGRIVTTDVTELAPAWHEGDAAHLLPRSADPAFADALTRICSEEHVSLVIPLIDPDLLPLAQHREMIESSGARVLVSNARAIEICRDKSTTCRVLAEHGFPVPREFSPDQARHHGFPVFLKPRRGSASQNVFKINNPRELDFFSQYVSEPLIQEFLDGDEVTTDVFSDWSGRPVVAVPRKRLKTRGGEVSIACVELDPELEDLCTRIATMLGTVGPINIQAMRSTSGTKVTEINPRFGGGCPLSINAGAPLAEWAVQLAMGRPLPTSPPPVNDGLTMMRFDDSIFIAASPVRNKRPLV